MMYRWPDKLPHSLDGKSCRYTRLCSPSPGSYYRFQFSFWLRSLHAKGCVVKLFRPGTTTIIDTADSSTPSSPPLPQAYLHNSLTISLTQEAPPSTTMAGPPSLGAPVLLTNDDSTSSRPAVPTIVTSFAEATVDDRNEPSGLHDTRECCYLSQAL
jgi:hypothetical protein